MKERSPRVAKDDDLEQHLLARCHCTGPGVCTFNNTHRPKCQGHRCQKSNKRSCNMLCMYYKLHHTLLRHLALQPPQFTHMCTRPACRASVYAFGTSTQPFSSELTVRAIQILDNLIYKQSRRQPACSKSRLATPLDSLMLLPNYTIAPGLSSHVLTPVLPCWKKVTRSQ